MEQDFTDYYNLGRIVKPIGSQGEFQVILDTTHPEEYLELESVFVNLNGNLIPFFIEQFSLLSKSKVRMKFEDVELEELEPLIGKGLYLPLTSLPQLDDSQFYYFEVEGFEMYEDSDKIGVIETVVDNPGNPIIVVRNGEHEILVPKTKEIVQRVDRASKKLYVKLPEGLLSVYLNE